MKGKVVDTSDGFKRECDTCGKNVIPAFDVNTTCHKCKTIKWHEEHPESEAEHMAGYMQNKQDMKDAEADWYN